MRIEYDEAGLKAVRVRLDKSLEQYNEATESFTDTLKHENSEEGSACADALNSAGQAYAQLLDHMDYAIQMYSDVQEKLLQMGERIG